MTTTIWWLRRDLRLHDNQALLAALAAGTAVIPLFILDPALLASDYVGAPRLAFLLASLRELDSELQARGGRLIVRRGRPVTVLPALLAETGAAAVFAEADVTPYARRRDAAVAAVVPLRLSRGLTALPVDGVLKDDGEPYVVFTPYSHKWRAALGATAVDPLPAPARVPVPAGVASDPLPDTPVLADTVPFPPGAAEGQRRLAEFGRGPVFDYAERRDLPAVKGTARLSPYLRFGLVSAREAVAAARAALAAAPDKAAGVGANTWLTELIWREFYQMILYHYPHVRRGSFRPVYDQIAWRNDAAEFAAWCAGATGYPIVDAAMHELNASGWMHNRARMIVASFLVKDLLIDWRWGERYFMQRLVDGDPAANNGGWQWTAGTGTDAAPYFRIFNPTSQGKKFDPDGVYVRRWLPALQAVPDKYVHEPWRMPAAVQEEAGCRIGSDYPAPIVDHKMARERTLAAYKAARA